jgi:hypothetical protein
MSCSDEDMSDGHCSTVQPLGSCETIRKGVIQRMNRYLPSDSVNEIELDTLLRKTIDSTRNFNFLKLRLILT